MNRKKINDLIYKVSENLGYPPDVVAHMVYYSFAKVKQTLVDGDSANIRLLHLGSFSANPKAVYNEIKNQISLIRKHKAPENYAKLRVMLKLRHKANDYSKSRKFKERFNSWHYKAAGGQDADQA